MRFFDRKEEIAKLREIQQMSLSNAQFTIITGRRRIGKTSMVLKAFEDQPLVYFFVSRKAEAALCEDFQQELENKLKIITMGKATSFATIFEQLMIISERQNITLFIDEFQEFLNVNKSIYSDMQRIWDLHKNNSRLNLIVCGSVYSLMGRIFKNEKEPLFGRETAQINLKPFRSSTLKEIMQEYNPGYSNEDLLALYTFTGGVAKYVENLVNSNALTLYKILNKICEKDSIFISDGKSTLIEEFGRDYGIYFSILSAIANGHNSRSKIEEIIGKEVSGYLTKLDSEYGLISKHQPMFEKSAGTNLRYKLDDNFFIFWFRFIYKYNYMLEIGAYGKLLQIIERDYNVFSGLALEKYFKEVMMESNKYTRIGNWWNRKGDVEIDIISADELENTAEFYEVKRRKENFSPKLLEERKDAFLSATHQFKNYRIECKGLSIEDM